MILNCINCTKEFEGKTKRSAFCSTKCKLSYHRNNSSVSNDTQTTKNDTESPDTESSVSSTPVEGNSSVSNEQKLTKTDQLFQNDAVKRGLGANWLLFSDIVRSPECANCKKTFKSRLPLLNYCSPDCRAKQTRLSA